ncbi:MAG: lytic transglycosylase domain-containing protein [Pseudomonadota bacterium]|nr:lytic transglycosylase domain-containing protein [Pseudomonadota bacterium]
MLTAVTAASVMAVSSHVAQASLGKTPHRGHAQVAAVVSKQAHLTRPAHARTPRARSAWARAHAPAPALVHRDVVPLVNTTWDHPAVSPAVLGAIRKAARDTGIDPNLLMAIAWRESRFDPQARNRHSSANGLLQFTSGTWLQTVHEFGAQHGAAAYAAAIHKERFGELTVHGQHMRAVILRLRSDPLLSATLAAESMGRQRAAMQTWLGRSATSADLYLLHVLGPSGAARFLTALAQHPSVASLEVASRTTLRNAGLLARDGRPMTVGSTYAAVRVMLDAQRAHAEPLIAAADGKADASRPALVEVSEAP